MDKTMSDDELCALIRTTADHVEKSNPKNIASALTQLREVVEPNCHLGKKGEFSRRETLEWYAGQLLDIVDSKAWFAVNSWLNCVDKFAKMEG